MQRSSVWKQSKKARSKQRVALERRDERLKRLSAPITIEQINSFLKHLIAVSFGAGEECWIFVGSGRAKKLSDDITFAAGKYHQVRCNGEMVGAHKFALAVAEGVALASLDGFDVHHDSELGRCIGYRCCNPDHLQKREHRPHSGTRGVAGSLNPHHTKLVREVLGVNPIQRRPEEHRAMTGAASKRRFLGGIPFLIRLGELTGIEE